MPRTRSGVASNQSSPEEESTRTSKGEKRHSVDEPQSRNATKRQSQTKSKSEPQSKTNEQETRPRLTTPDLEFDYDRSQLRDPRPTPGRVARPRRQDRELTKEWKDQLYIPEPVKLKGRLNWVQKDEVFQEKCLLDPSESFHHLYVCHRKGPNGSPTYDSGGFELDWHKVDQWMKPEPYNKKAMVRGMERAVDKAQKERREMNEIFFLDGKAPDNHMYERYMKDHVSKNLGVPIHQITPAHFQDWERKGFPKVKASQWWREPNEVEKLRDMKMLEGGSLRKDL